MFHLGMIEPTDETPCSFNQSPRDATRLDSTPCDLLHLLQTPNGGCFLGNWGQQTGDREIGTGNWAVQESQQVKPSLKHENMEVLEVVFAGFHG